jgi:carboxylesterase type B
MGGKSTFARYPYPYKPIVDDFSATPYLPDEPLALVAKGAFNQVPTIIGYNRDEGLLNTARMFKNESAFKELAEEWDVIVPFVMFGR